MRKLLTSGVALGLLASILCAGQEAQQPSHLTEQRDGQPKRAKAPTGTLTGTVYCTDTNLPARRAQISLLQYAPDSFSRRGAGVTDLNGQFTTRSILEGSYYVVAVLPGYTNLLSTLTKSHLDAMTEDERKKLLAQVPSVRISADQPAQVAIQLERGAEIDGKVAYDDGSPAIGLRISWKLTSREGGKELPPAQGMGEEIAPELPPNLTDEHGRFRIAGVAPGEYLVGVVVPTESAEHAVTNPIVALMDETVGAMEVYVGGGLRPSKAETVKVGAGADSGDADITIPLSKMHTIRGQVVLKRTGQPPPNASVQLLYADTKEPLRTAIAPNGEFELHWVPEGAFLLRAAASRERLPEADFPEDDEGNGFATSTSFVFSLNTMPEAHGSAEMPLLVAGDVDHLSIAVPDPPAGNAKNARSDGQDTR
jgi:hypothetical protein